MPLVFFLVVAATFADGLFAGIAVQKLFVELPARKKIGAVAFAHYSRASDMGNGFYIYPSFAIGGLLLKGLTYILALKSAYPLHVLVPLGFAVSFGIGVLVTTAFAAPQMLRLRRMEDKEELLSPLLENFVTYSYPRAVFMWLQFAALLWALIAIRQ